MNNIQITAMYWVSSSVILNI